MSQPAPRRRRHEAAQLLVGQRARLVHDERRPVAADLLDQALGRPARLLDRAVDVERPRRRPGRVRDQPIEAADGAQAADERALREAVGRLDRRRVGDRDQDRDVGRQPQVQRQRRIGRSEIEHDVVDVQRRDRRQRHLGRHARARGAERAAVARDQPDAGDRRVGDQLAEPAGLAAQELAESARRPRRAQQLVKRAARRVGVERHHLLPRLRQVDRDVGRQQRAAGAAASRGERDQLGARARPAPAVSVLSALAGRRVVFGDGEGVVFAGGQARRRRRRHRLTLRPGAAGSGSQSSSSTFQ